ncbi:MAG: winged helix-turn-helix transcriptional regulator [Chloroflexota bacterium]
MANKTYNQYCAIANALDIVGERWTLLVVRNLLAGPKRFSDLQKGLPGISTNVLTDRLKKLEANDTIASRYLPAPAASNVYELTPTGYELVSALGALARWGAMMLGEPTDDQHIVPESVIFMILGMFWGKGNESISLTCNLQVDSARYSEIFAITLSEGQVMIAQQPHSEPDITFTTPLHTLLQLSSQQLRMQDAIKTKLLTVSGEQSVVDSIVAWVDSTAN